MLAKIIYSTGRVGDIDVEFLIDGAKRGCATSFKDGLADLWDIIANGPPEQCITSITLTRSPSVGGAMTLEDAYAAQRRESRI